MAPPPDSPQPERDPRRTRAFVIGGALLAAIFVWNSDDIWDDNDDHGVHITIGDDDKDEIEEAVRENVRQAVRGGEDREEVRDRVDEVRENMEETGDEIRRVAEEGRRTGNEEAAEAEISEIVEEAIEENIEALTE